MAAHHSLGYEGFRPESMPPEVFAEKRALLREAIAEIDICRRAFRDPRFLRIYRGTQSAYGSKHYVEKWDFDLNPRARGEAPNDSYNGYVCQGSAVAAALLEGFVVKPSSMGAGSAISFPRKVR